MEFRCFSVIFNPHKKRFPCPQISTVPLSSLLSTKDTLFPLPPPNRCAQPAEGVLTPSEEISERTQSLARPDAQNYPTFAAAAAVDCRSTSSDQRVSAGSLKLIKYRIRKLTLMRTIWMSLNLYIFWHNVRKTKFFMSAWCSQTLGHEDWQWLLILSACQGQPVTPAGESRTRTVPISYWLLHQPHPRQQQISTQQPQCLSSFSQAPAEASLSFMFLRREVSATPWYDLSLELSRGIRSLRSPIEAKMCSKPKWMVYNTVLKHWGVIPSQFWPPLAQIPQVALLPKEQWRNAPWRVVNVEYPGLQLCTMNYSQTTVRHGGT